MTYRVRTPFHEELLYDLLHARGMTTKEEQTKFLTPDFLRDSHDPFLLPDLPKAVERIQRGIANQEPIAVWSDYDCDGIPGGVMLVEFFRLIGYPVRHYIPHRHKEGYGLNEAGLTQLAQEGVRLIITVDLGISERDAVEFAKTLGIDIIITDHHLVSGRVPDAHAVINPKRADNQYPFDGLCGAGVAWKLVQGILSCNRYGLKEGQEKWLLDLVGIATLADMVPLLDENRMLARYGLMVMRRARRPGIAALLSLLRIRPSTLTEDDIGFMIAPRINAASRMDAPETAARLLATGDTAEARTLARTLQQLNQQRKTLVATIAKEVNKRLLDQEDASVIVMGNPSWRPGVLGLVANSLAGTHKKPVFLWGREGGDMIRGSCRSDGILNVVELMQGAGDVFSDFGGHHASGGFSLTHDRVPELSKRLQESYQRLHDASSVFPDAIVERELPLSEVLHAHKVLLQLAPFGQGNPKPLFVFPRVSIGNVRSFGKGGEHVSLQLSMHDTAIPAISFFMTPEAFQKPLEAGITADIVGHIETDWKGASRIRVVDVI